MGAARNPKEISKHGSTVLTDEYLRRFLARMRLGMAGTLIPHPDFSCEQTINCPTNESRVMWLYGLRCLSEIRGPARLL